jgi:hypothetical protein
VSVPEIRIVARPLRRLQGRTYDLSSDTWVSVDGLYTLSTITVNGRAETVAFLERGRGPSQIENPLARRELTVEGV